ncbi:MAG: GNAT family N-acetyltransferase [Phaeodactylibacter sp.]|nr:GNAT family N-acetyltransferase [Phaeodactylibacter sp.]
MNITNLPESFQVERKEEFSLSTHQQRGIQRLLKDAFPGYPDRTFYRQLPDFRYLGYHEDKLMAHMAVEHRLLHNAGDLHQVFGIMDLCVDPMFQRRRIGSYLLEQISTLGQANGIDFLVLIAGQHQLYLDNGFQLVSNPCIWMMISGNQSLGLTRRSVNHSLMVKPLSGKQWQEGLVDFLGPIL